MEDLNDNINIEREQRALSVRATMMSLNWDVVRLRSNWHCLENFVFLCTRAALEVLYTMGLRVK